MKQYFNVCKNKEMTLSEIRGKRLALIGGGTIKEEVITSAEKYRVSVVGFGSSRSPVKNKVFMALNKYFPKATKYLLEVCRLDAVLLISGERLINRNVRWLSRSKYPFYASEEQYNILMNKDLFEEYAAQFGLSAIPRYRLDSFSKKVVDEVEYPVVIKPVDNSGSSGVSICSCESELEKALTLAINKSPRKRVICQKYLTGSYFQFEIWLQNGKSFFPYIKDRVFYNSVGNHPPQPFIDFYPSDNQELISSYLFSKVEKLMDSLQIKNGSCMFQGIINDGIPYIMDVAFRVSGGLDFKVVKKETNVDLIEAHILYSLGKNFGYDFSRLHEPFSHSYAVLCIGLKNGVISLVEGLETIKEKAYVFDCFQHYRIGHRITTSGLFSQTVFRFFLVDDSKEKLISDVKEILKILRIEDEDGNSMLLEYPVF